MDTPLGVSLGTRLRASIPEKCQFSWNSSAKTGAASLSNLKIGWRFELLLCGNWAPWFRTSVSFGVYFLISYTFLKKYFSFSVCLSTYLSPGIPLAPSLCDWRDVLRLRFFRCHFHHTSSPRLLKPPPRPPPIIYHSSRVLDSILWSDGRTQSVLVSQYDIFVYGLRCAGDERRNGRRKIIVK